MANDKIRVNIVLVVLLVILFLYSVFITFVSYRNGLIQQSYSAGLRDGITLRNQQIFQDLQTNGFTVLTLISNDTNQTQRIILVPQMPQNFQENSTR